MMTEQELDGLIMDVNELAVRIEAVNNLINSMEDPLLRKYYSVDLLAMIKWYHDLSHLLLEQLEAYKAQEQGNTVQMKYRRVLKALKESMEG